MNSSELNNLISIRDFAMRNFDNINFRLSKDEVRLLGAKISQMDKIILVHLLAFDPNISSKAKETQKITEAPAQPKKVEKMKVKRSEEALA